MNMTKNGSDVTVSELLDAFTHLADFSLCRNPVETNSTTCAQLEDIFTALTLINILLAILAMLAMQCLQTRVKLLSNCMRGRPGILIPVNLLTHTKYRLIYVAIFGSMSSEFLKVITGRGGISVSTPNPYSQSIVSILLTLLFGVLMCISYYPLFASVDTPVPILGHIIGTVFAIYLFILTLIREYGVFTGCFTGCQAEGLPLAIKVLSDVPIVLLQFFLVLWYLWSIVHDVYVMVVPSKHTSAKDILIKDHLDRVKHRLRRKDKEYSKPKKGLKKIIFKIYPYDSGFKFPLRFLSGMIVSIVFIYQMSLLTMFSSIQLAIAFQKTRNDIFDALDNLNAVSGEIELNNDSSLDQITSTVKNIGNSLYGLVVLLTISMLIGSICSFAQIFLTFRNVSKHLHQLAAQKDRSFPTLQNSLMGSLRYPGYAIAYTVWAWVIYALLLMVFGIIIIIGIGAIYYLFQWIGPKIAVVGIGVVWTLLLYIIQFVIVKYVFVMKAHPDSEHKVLNNRRLMHWFSYILLFQNAFVGIFSTFFRIIVSLAFGLLTFSRLDHSFLIREWEWMDSANKTYMGMIYLDYRENNVNSMMNAFCHILLEQCKDKRLNTEPSCCGQTQSPETDNDLQSVTDSPSRPRLSLRAYNRWMVAYTLIKNEQLTGLKKRRNDSVGNNEEDRSETRF